MGRVDIRKRAEALRKTEEEIRQEVADSFGRAGRLLEEAIAELMTQLDRLADAPEQKRAGVRAACVEQRRRAEYRRWCLLVQRECLDLRDHTEVERVYRLPDVPE